MTGITNDVDRRQEPRYRIVSEHTVEVLVQRTSEESEEPVRGELIDLSPGGVQVCLPTYLQFLEVVGVRIVVPEASVNIDATAEVCWIRPTEDNRCVVGCSFTLRISEAVVERMAEAGYIDRRRHPRHAADLRAVARWELDADEFPVQITDYSEGGFRMVSDRPCTVGATVSVHVESSDEDQPPISAKVCWQEEREGRYFLGCAMKRLSDFQRLDDLCRHECDVEEQVAGGVKEILFLAATWLFLFIGSTLLGLTAIDAWQSPSLPPDADYRPVAFSSSTGPVPDDGKPTPADLKINPPEKPPSQAEPPAEHETPSPTVLPPVIETPQGTGADPPKADSFPTQTADAEIPRSDFDSQEPTLDPENVHSPEIPPTRDSIPAPPEPAVGPHGFGASSMPAASSLDPSGTADFSGEFSAAEARSNREMKGPQSDVEPELPASSDSTVAQPASDLEKAKEALIEGDRFYRDQDYGQALDAFRTAAQYDSANALPHYLLAMAYYQLNQFREAETAVRKAIRLEQRQPIENWGSRLTRYQGRPRLWIEQQRSAMARVTR